MASGLNSRGPSSSNWLVAASKARSKAEKKLATTAGFMSYLETLAGYQFGGTGKICIAKNGPE